ncbi:MAG: hypothetical protein WCD89_07525 [Anaerocolumna sp.]
MNNKMNKLIIFLLIITNIVSLAFIYSVLTIPKSKVYCIEGKNEDFILSNGYIIFSDHNIYINGGTLYKLNNDIDNNIQSYEMAIYYAKNNENNYILNKASIMKNRNFPENLLKEISVGKHSLMDNLEKDDINYIKNNLYFILKYTDISGNNQKVNIHLNLKEIEY